MKTKILEFINKRHQEKREQKKIPHYITFLEMSKHLGGIDKQLLRELVREKQIEWGRTLNDIWFAPKYTSLSDHTTAKKEPEVVEISIKTTKSIKPLTELINELKNG